MARSLALLASLAFAAACGSPPPAAVEPAPGEPDALAGITAAHNSVRAAVGVGPLTWDPALAATAAAWAAGCQDQDLNGLLDHNPNRSVGSPVYVGENIYGSTNTLSYVTGADAVNAWASEARYYTYGPYPDTCTAGHVCGHYTQIVWRSTTRLGCAKQDCPAILPYHSTIVCDYAPGGNVVGQYPY